MNEPIHTTVQDIFDYHKQLDIEAKLRQSGQLQTLNQSAMEMLQRYQDSTKAHDWARSQALAQQNSHSPYGRGLHSSSALGTVLGGIFRGVL